MLKNLVHFHQTDNACLKNRVVYPSKYCFSQHLNHILAYELPNRDANFQAFHIHGIHSATGIIEILKFKLRGKKFIWSLDDDYLSIPEWNGNRISDDYRDFYEMAFALADAIIVSTEELKKTLNRQNVYVAPNMIAEFIEPQKITSNNKRIKLLWQGSTTHKKDLEILEKPLLRILEEFDVDIVFWGANPSLTAYKNYIYNNISTHPIVPITRYSEALFAIQPDIMLAPLVDCPFNRSKSNLRLLDAWSCNSVPIASNVGEYKSTIEHGKDGLLCSTEDQWYSAIKSLIENKELLQTMKDFGYNKVKQKYNWTNPANVKQWNDIFEEICNGSK